MTRLVDLDDVSGLQQAIDELQRIHDFRNVDPELLVILENLLPKIESNVAAEIREALQTTIPSVVLAEWQDEFFAAKFSTPMPPVDAKNQSHFKFDPTITKETLMERARQQDHDDPTRLRGLVREIATFTDDREQIVRAAVAHAEACGIGEETFVPIIAEAIRKLPQGDQKNVG